MNRAIYPYRPVWKVSSLCLMLGLKGPELQAIVERVSNLYIGPIPKQKKNGGFREVFNTKPPLKPLLKRINRVFLRKVHFPPYLTGSLPGKDSIVNVDIHKKSRHVITEDIAQFFDCVTEKHVYTIWRKFFQFGDEVAMLLTKLTTKGGRLVQGASTSSYLANLVFWCREPVLVEKLKAKGIRYSRYVDDITLSSTSKLSKDDRRWAIGQVYAMLGAAGFKPQRAKHNTLSASGPITLMSMNANREPTLVKQRRSNIRTQVFQLEQNFARGDICGTELQAKLNQAGGKVGYLRRLHAQKGATLRRRLDKVQSGFEGRLARQEILSNALT